MTKKRNIINLIKAFCLALVLGAVPIIIWFLTNKSEIRTSEDKTYVSVSSLQCSLTNSEEAFFNPENVQRYEHTVKLLIKNGYLNAISYNYEGTYSSNQVAENEMSRFQAIYNKYMGKNGLETQSLSPNFSTVKTKVTISLYAERKKINSGILPIFFLEREDIEKIEKYDGKELEKYYKNKGFSCTFKE